MNEEMIGTLAGKIWAVLSEQPMTVKELKTITKLKEAEIYAAIGWLSREGKMTVTPKGKDFFYSFNKKSQFGKRCIDVLLSVLPLISSLRLFFVDTIFFAVASVPF